MAVTPNQQNFLETEKAAFTPENPVWLMYSILEAELIG
jgi:hypothetical protein